MVEPTRASGFRGRRLWLWIGLTLLVVLALLYGRALFESHRALQAARRLESSDLWGAIRQYRHAIEWYAPGNPFSREAANALLQLGLMEGETDEERVLELNALESLRTGILVTRSLYIPYRDSLEPIEERIAHLRARDLAGSDPERLASEQVRLRQLLIASRHRAPHAWWSLVTCLAFLGWIGLTWGALRQAYPPDRQGNLKRTVVLSCMSAIALALWIVGLLLV